MGRALISGIRARGGFDIFAASPSEKARRRLADEFGIAAAADISHLPNDADILILAVKPQHIGEAAARIQFGGKPSGDSLLLSPTALAISIAAGIRAQTLSQKLGGHRAIVRAMPNTPAMVCCGMTAGFALDEVTKSQRNSAREIFESVGDFAWVKNESAIEAITALSGSGPAYIYYIVEAMEKAAKEAGLDSALSRRAIVQTLRGAAAMVEGGGSSLGGGGMTPAELRIAVTSKGGTTERAINLMEDKKFADILIAAIRAAHFRAIEIGDEFDRN